MSSNPLFQPFSHKSLSLANRVVMAPMTRSRSPNGKPGEDVAAYYRRRAEGGVGLIVTEGTTVDRPGASNNENIPNFYEPASLEGWKRVVKEVHAAGGKIAPQLWHQGMVRKPGSGPRPDGKSDGPSGLSGTGKPVGEPMTEEDIADTIEAFAKAAAVSKEIGFDCVELHGAHGYLIDQFFWDGANKRTDIWGGDLVRRTRFAVEIVKAVRKRVGPDYVIIQRFSQWKQQDYAAKLALTANELEQFLGPLTDAGVDIYHASTRRFWEPEFEGSDLNLAGWTRKITGLPAITVGSVGLKGVDFVHSLRNPGDASEVSDLGELETRLARGEFDLVAVGRALISDAAWTAKVRDGRTRELQPFSPEALKAFALSLRRNDR